MATFNKGSTGRTPLSTGEYGNIAAVSLEWVYSDIVSIPGVGDRIYGPYIPRGVWIIDVCARWTEMNPNPDPAWTTSLGYEPVNSTSTLLTADYTAFATGFDMSAEDLWSLRTEPYLPLYVADDMFLVMTSLTNAPTAQSGQVVIFAEYATYGGNANVGF